LPQNHLTLKTAACVLAARCEHQRASEKTAGFAGTAQALEDKRFSHYPEDFMEAKTVEVEAIRMRWEVRVQ
jgi:hypothetical protein